MFLYRAKSQFAGIACPFHDEILPNKILLIFILQNAKIKLKQNYRGLELTNHKNDKSYVNTTPKSHRTLMLMFCTDLGNDQRK